MERYITCGSMSTNIPPSLAWLVRRRRAIAGLLDQATKRQAQLQAGYEADQEQLKLQICALQQDLAAVDQTIGLHEILIDTTQLGATRVQLAPRLTDYGAITRAVLTVLRKARPQTMTTDAIVSSVCVQCDLRPDTAEYADIRLRVRQRLKTLANEGKVSRLHAPYSNTGGLWRAAGVEDGSATQECERLAPYGPPVPKVTVALADVSRDDPREPPTS